MRPWGVLGLAALVAASAAAGPVVLRPGESTRVSLSTARDAVAAIEVLADRDETLTIEARSLDLDVKISVGSSPPIEDDNGLGGTDASAAVQATAGVRYRVDLRPADFSEEAHGEVEVSVVRGAVPALDDAARAQADEAYWTSVSEAGEARNDAWLRVRGLLGVARIQYGNGAYGDMARSCEAASAIAAGAWGTADGRHAVAEAELGLARYLAGDLTGARAAVNAALPTLEARYGPDDERVGTALNYRGMIEEDLGELRIARDAYERSLAIREKLTGSDSPRIVAPLGNLAGLTDRLGDSERALVLYRRALAIVEAAPEPDPLRQASLLNNVAFELKRLGRVGEAIPDYERALAIRRSKLGEDHPGVAVCLQNLGVALHETGRTDEAIPMLERALTIREKRLGPDHPDVAVTLSNLARVLHESGRSAAAVPLSDRALRIRNDKLGPAHPDTARQRVFEARLLAAMGRNDEALTEALAAEDLGRADARRVARFLPEAGAMQYAARRASGLDVALGVVTAGSPSPADVKRVWQSAARSRALVLDEMARRAKALRANEAPSVRAAREATEKAVGAWTRLVTGGGGLKGDALRAAVDTSLRDLEASERALAEVSASYRREVATRDPSWDDVSRAVPPGSSLVSFVRYERAGPPVETRCAAFVRTPKGTPRIVDLGPAAPIDASIAAWRTAIAAAGGGDVDAERAKESAARLAGEALRRAIWDPISVETGDAAEVVVVPDGAIHLVPFAALPAAEGGYLVEHAPLFHYVSSERDLLAAAKGTERGSMLALGGPAFDGGSAPSAPGAGSATTNRGRSLSACGEGPPLRFDPLPHAAREAENVAGLVGLPSRVLVGARATETAFKSLAPASTVVHLATHGFVLGDRCPAGQSPLQLAGLAFAGANRATPGLSSDDGVLTAEEIATLDLTRAEWVALSSCDSGGGAVARGEGVLGLRRAFTIAGASTLVLAVWPVDDKDARRWMSAVYRARFERRLPPAEATQVASLAVLRERRGRGLDTSPYHWGAFVAAGR